MTRHSRNQDAQLLEAGIKLLPEMGGRDLSLRQVAEHAHVNLGMIHYHFKTKDEFLRAVLAETFERLRTQVDFENFQKETPLETIRELLFRFGKFAREHRHLAITLMSDFVSGDPVTRNFLLTKAPLPIGRLKQLIEEAQELKQIRKMSAMNLLPAMIGVVNMPHFLTAAMERAAPSESKQVSAMRAQALTDEALRERIDFLIRGIQV